MSARLALTALALGLLLPTVASSQACTGSDDYWSNDILPQVPVGSFSVSIIPGLCVDEGAAQVFYTDAGTPELAIDSVSCGFGNQFGLGGFSGAANIEIYDGITWNNGIPTLGPKVFDLEVDASANTQVSTHGINEFDMTPFNVTVTGQGTAFVVAWRMRINNNGDCATGYTSNFFTDNAGGGGGCNTTPMTSLMDISGQGWRDASTATVLGFPLCPTFYNGNWVIRACTSDAGAPPVCQTDIGLQGPGTVELSICGGDLSTGTVANFLLTDAPPGALVVMFVGLQLNPQFIPKVFGTLGPLPPLSILYLATDGNGEINVPSAVPGGGGPVSVYMQAVVEDASQIKDYAVSNCLRVDFLP